MSLVWFQFTSSKNSLMKDRMDLAQGPVFVREVARVACLLRHYCRSPTTFAPGFRSKISPDKLANGLDYCGIEHFVDWDRFLSLSLLTWLLTYSMQQSPSWEANRSSASQEIPRVLCNPKVHYRSHKCPPPVPILNSSMQSIPPDPTSWRSILILSSHLRLGLPSGLFPSGFPTKTLYKPLFFPIRITCPVNFSIWSPEQYWARSIYGDKFQAFPHYHWFVCMKWVRIWDSQSV